jgi:hypothetical protein
LEQEPLWIEQELAGIVSTLRPEQEPVEIPPERIESLLRRLWPVGVFLGIGAASYALPSIDFDLVLPTHSTGQNHCDEVLGGVVAVLTFIGFMSEYGFWKVAAWAVGVPLGLGLGLLGLLIILSPQAWSSLQETFNAPLTFGGAFVLMLVFVGLTSRS